MIASRDSHVLFCRIGVAALGCRGPYSFSWVHME